jgi:hypothetical protein
MKEKLYKVVVTCRMSPPYDEIGEEPKLWKEYYFVTAKGETEALKKAVKKSYCENCWDEEDAKLFKATAKPSEVTEIKNKDLVGKSVRVNPKFFNEQTEYTIEDYKNGNYLVTSKMWLQKSDIELIPTCKLKERVKL